MNPRAAINDLHPFQGCPFGQLGYFSKMCRILVNSTIQLRSRFDERIDNDTIIITLCQTLFHKLFHKILSNLFFTLYL